MTDLEPVAFDSTGNPISRWQVGDRLDDETRRRLLERIDEGKA